MLEVDKSLRSNVYTSNRYIDPDPMLRTRYLLEGSMDNGRWFVLTDKRKAETNLPHDYLSLVKLRYVRIMAKKLPYDEPFALSGLRVFGFGNTDIPDVVQTAEITQPDALTARLRLKEKTNALYIACFYFTL